MIITPMVYVLLVEVDLLVMERKYSSIVSTAGIFVVVMH